ncbi:MAG: hypothetical protein JKY49_08585 [Cohaesibacteraceae bacterium]|nr:hypothetical protein [Cohaesibacteraceae bacterium]MBL4876717.1 hypothetical protein [Cohaesibacteraceae bacterium]
MKAFCKLTFDGSPSELVTNHLLSVAITLNSGGEPDKLSIKLTDPQADLPRPRGKAKVLVTLGYSENNKRQFGPFMVDDYGSGKEEEESDVLEFTATSVDFNSKAKGRSTMTHKNTTLGDILKKEAANSDFILEVSAELAAFPYEHFVRGEKSLIQMVGELAGVHDAIEKYVGNKIIFMTRAGGVDIKGKPITHSLGRSELKAWGFKRNYRSEYKGVKAAYQDKKKGKRVVVKEQLDKGDAWYEHRKLFPTKKLAQTAAKSKTKQLKRKQKSLNITTKIGDVDILEQADLTFSEVSPDVDGVWSVTTVNHDYDAGEEAFQTSATLEPKE